MNNLTIIESADAVRIADWIERRLVAALAGNDSPVAITVPGGSTPFPIFGELIRRDLDFARLHIWPGDDRMVPEDHEASNTGRIRTLFEPVGAAIMALDCAQTPPHFSLAWMGMGADGHIASLFPNTDPQVDEERRIIRLTPDPLPPEAPFDRISLTIPALLDSEEIMFTLGGGEDKRRVFDGAAKGDHDLPIARLLGAANQPVTCFT